MSHKRASVLKAIMHSSSFQKLFLLHSNDYSREVWGFCFNNIVQLCRYLTNEAVVKIAGKEIQLFLLSHSCTSCHVKHSRSRLPMK